MLPHTSVEEVDAFLSSAAFGGSVEDALDKFKPSNIVIVGGSKGIGRANACYFAGLGSKVISLSTTLPTADGSDLASPIECPAAGSIINVKYDIAAPRRPLSRILKEHNMASIDLLLLNAARDALGALRDWQVHDLQRVYSNNVFGHHKVWLEARDYLNTKLAVVLGVSSAAAETRFIARRYPYHMSKHALKDLILGYAVEEEFVQPNTHYAVLLQNDVKTNFGLTRISPRRGGCKNEFEFLGGISNAVVLAEGQDIDLIAPIYHKIYARIVGAKFLMSLGQEIPRAAIPQTFNIEPEEVLLSLTTAEFNHRILPAEVTNQCYGEFWDGAAGFLLAGCPDPSNNLLCPDTGADLAPAVDPRIVMECAGP